MECGRFLQLLIFEEGCLRHRWKDQTAVSSGSAGSKRDCTGSQAHSGMRVSRQSGYVETLNAGKRPTMGDTRFVLTEFSEVHDFRFIQERCYELISNGYEPIIAHAERYPVIRKNLEHLEQLVDMGAYIQMNADSISGVEGWGMKRVL